MSPPQLVLLGQRSWPWVSGSGRARGRTSTPTFALIDEVANKKGAKQQREKLKLSMKINDHVPGPMSIECPVCDAYVVAQPQGHLVYYDPREGLPERWTLLACERKGHPLLVVQEELATGMAFEEDRPHRVWPSPGRELSDLISRKLRNSHEEARRCFRIKAYRATVVMCGITLEGACQLGGAKKATLHKM